MSKNKVILETHSVQDTQCFGEHLGQWVKESASPLCMALIGDLGTGKTHMSQGIAKGLGVSEDITSPTFSLMNTYMTLAGEIYHFDLYRMDDVSELENIGFYEFTEDQVAIVEWADKFEDELPDETLWIHIDSIDTYSRRITLESDVLDAETLNTLGGMYVVGN